MNAAPVNGRLSPVAPRQETERAEGPAGPSATSLPFTSPWLLAPMEGVTAPTFRGLVLGLYSPAREGGAANLRDAAHMGRAAQLGGAFTEFVRVIDRPVAPKEIVKHLGEERFAIPVGVQLMGRDLEAVEGSARNVAELGVPVLDLNFGCPARGALKGCAGAAALKDPRGVQAAVEAAVRGVGGRIPVTAKIRAGFDHARDVEVLARAAEAGGAAMLTIHCRTRREGYCDQVDWSRIQRAVDSVSIPVAGNGSAWVHADLERMRRETGCAYVMVGRGALADPWMFSGRTVSRAEAARFLFDYGRSLTEFGASAKAAVGRIKQLVGYWTAGDLFPTEEARVEALRRTDYEDFLRDLERDAATP